ncbi:MAG: hypothetical protein A3H36_00910 [Chloroflexi bacterium RIFCSPLOWO2_02_FULL_71_16]|nr:MAG: hypothetical protein A3H36_00910 [Chloroflexi bacterium RIFCSPLOWO2_02_FULL_71_16]
MNEARQIVSGLILALSSFGLFVFLSSAVAAILFGTTRAPGFIRAAAWLYSRPRSGPQWLGLAIAMSIALGTQWAVTQAIATDGDTFGLVGLGILWSELAAATAWLGYLVYLYVIRPARH